MDSLITAAARALAAGDPLDALNRVAQRSEHPIGYPAQVPAAGLESLSQPVVPIAHRLRFFIGVRRSACNDEPDPKDVTE